MSIKEYIERQLVKENVKRQLNICEMLLKLCETQANRRLCAICGAIAAPRISLCHACNWGIEPNKELLLIGKKLWEQKKLAEKKAINLKQRISQFKKTELYKRICKKNK